MEDQNQITLEIFEQTTDEPVADSVQPNIETLTAEIKMYLHIANQSIIEVGKRLIQAKELVPHGEWQHWLENNFNLSYRMAAKFIQIAERFGKNQPNSNVPTSAHFDVSTFKASTLVELLALPEGEEEKFIEQKAAEGNPADQMTIKQLRAEINEFKKNNADLEKKTSHFESRVKEAVLEMEKYKRQSEYLQAQSDEYKAKLEQRPTVEVPPADYEDLQRELKELRERPIDVTTELPADYESTKQKLAQLESDADSFRRDLSTRLSLENFLKSLPADLINADNLQSVVYSCAVDNLQDFESQIVQLSTFISLLQHYLNTWKDDPANNPSIDRDYIINEIKQTMANDSSSQTSDYMLALISSWGYEKLHDIPDDLLPDLLQNVRNFTRLDFIALSTH